MKHKEQAEDRELIIKRFFKELSATERLQFFIEQGFPLKNIPTHAIEKGIINNMIGNGRFPAISDRVATRKANIPNPYSRSKDTADHCTLSTPSNSEEGEQPGKEESVQKPPIGLMPRWRWNELRVEAINEAIHRYTVKSKEIPPEWIDELNELTPAQADK